MHLGDIVDGEPLCQQAGCPVWHCTSPREAYCSLVPASQLPVICSTVQDGSPRMDSNSLSGLHPDLSLQQEGLTPEHCLQVSTPQKLQRLLFTVLFRRLTSFRGLYTICSATTACVSINQAVSSVAVVTRMLMAGLVSHGSTHVYCKSSRGLGLV